MCYILGNSDVIHFVSHHAGWRETEYITTGLPMMGVVG